MNDHTAILGQANAIFNFLYIREKPVKANAIIGFGHFDLKIPRQCAELYLQGYAPKIIFTGGVGAGSADFEHSEAIEFLHFVNKEFPQIPAQDIITESESTNTGENLRFTETVLQQLNPDYTFLTGIKRVLKVSNAYRQRRAFLTCKKIFPGVEFINTPADTNFEKELELYRQKNQDLVRHITGEMERMITYPALNYIEPVVIPEEILEAYEVIKAVAPKYN